MKKNIVSCMALILLGIVTKSPTVIAAEGPAWTPTSNNIQTINIDFLNPLPAHTLYMFDWGNTAETMPISAPLLLSRTIEFSMDSSSGMWTAFDANEPSLNINLGTSQLFGLALYDMNTLSFEYDYNYRNSSTNTWSLTSMDPGATPFVAVDANPVPVPGALYLLGSGIIGLMAVRRKR